MTLCQVMSGRQTRGWWCSTKLFCFVSRSIPVCWITCGIAPTASASSTWWALWRVSVYLMSTTQVTRSPKALQRPACFKDWRPEMRLELLAAFLLPISINATLFLLFFPLHFSTQISCVSSSTELANRVRFRYYFQLLPTEASIAPAYFGVIQRYGWRRVGLIVQNENLFTVVWLIMKLVFSKQLRLSSSSTAQNDSIAHFHSLTLPTMHIEMLENFLH